MAVRFPLNLIQFGLQKLPVLFTVTCCEQRPMRWHYVPEIMD